MNKKSLTPGQELYKKDYGYIIYKNDDKDCSIDYIEIDKTRRGEGLGRELLKEFIQLQRDKNINYFELEAFITDNATIKKLESLSNFYKSLGFLEAGRDTEDTEEARIFLFLEFIEDDKIIPLWFENSLSSKKEKTAFYLYSNFLKSEIYVNFNKGLFSLSDSLNLFISSKEYLNSTIERNDLLLLTEYILKKEKDKML